MTADRTSRGAATLACSRTASINTGSTPPAPSPALTFQLHQQYTKDAPTSPYRLLPAKPPIERNSVESRRALAGAGELLRAAGVQAVYLVHGTFVGDDFFGVARMLERPLPSVAEWLRRLSKGIADRVASDRGNYPKTFAQRLEAGINDQQREPIAVRRLVWSGENHHLARFDAALRLIEHLAQQRFPAGSRVMLWGHSHSGNVFALASQLLYGSPHVTAALLDCCDVLLRSQRCRGGELTNSELVCRAEYVRQLLASDPLAGVTLDFVTFGTPIRYAWNDQMPGRLLHVVSHRPRRGWPEYRAYFPPTFEDVSRAADGDYLHQIGIAGTNTPLNVLGWRTMLADLRLNALLQPGIRRRDIFRRLRCGMRVAQSGTTLLVDYGELQGHMFRHIVGHAVYTYEAWLPFHASLVTRELYGG